MTKGKQPPADDITLRDVINHMNHKFDLIDSRFDKIDQRFDKLECRVEEGFAEAKRERAEILRRVEAEANAADDTMRRTHALEKRVNRIEKQLAM
jgi:DNA-binding IscR family transcriptional regulator